MNISLVNRWITRWEGRRAVAYDDATGEPIRPGVKVLGNPTIGVGLNLNTAMAHASITALGLDFAQVYAGAVTLTDDQIDHLLSECIGEATAGARRLVPALYTLPDAVQLVLIDLSFNMGEHRLAEFKTMLGRIEQKDWRGAANGLRDSAWFHQVGSALNHRGGADVAVLGGTAQPEDILALR